MYHDPLVRCKYENMKICKCELVSDPFPESKSSLLSTSLGGGMESHGSVSLKQRWMIPAQ